MNSPIIAVVLVIAALLNIARAITRTGPIRPIIHVLFAAGALCIAASSALGSESSLGTWSGILGACTFVAIGLVGNLKKPA